MRLIDADALIEHLRKDPLFDLVERYGIVDVIDSRPTIDIVRCKECKYGEYREDFDDYECHSSGCGLVYEANFFCADGKERKKDD